MPEDPESSTITTRPPLAAITGELVQPPSRVYLGVDDRLYVRSRNSLAAVTLQIAGRLLTADGIIVPFNFEHVPLTTRAVSLASFRLAEGYLLSVVVFPSVGAPRRGQTFVELGLLRGRNVAGAVVDVLARDYVAVDEPLAFPGGPLRSSIEGPGTLLSVAGSNPGAGNEILVAVPTNARWRVMSASARLDTDANVANRIFRWEFDDGTSIFFRTSANSNHPASAAKFYHAFAAGFQAAASTAFQSMPMPERLMLGAGFRIQSVTSAIESGDAFTLIEILVEEWIQD